MTPAGRLADDVSPRGRPSDTRNVVLVLSDDVGYGDIGCYGARDIRTPHIDGLASHGTRFTDFYASPTCTPTRAALMTGRYPLRVGLERPLRNASTPSLDEGLPATGRTLPQLLKNNGYATALVGKWHLGYRPEFQPNAHGFDSFFGFLSGYIDYYQHTGGDGKSDLYENGAPTRADGYTTDLLTAKAVTFIETHARRPFFLEVAYNAAHWPFQRPDRPSVAPDHGRLLQPHEQNASTRADYVAMVERLDHGVGQIVETLDRLGLRENTLVIYTNDNGGEWLSSNAPLFHRKDTLWEGGIRVPMVMRWPGHVPAASTSRQVGITMDLTASILAATGTAVPAGPALEGIDLLPILQGRTAAVERTLFFRLITESRQQRAVRQGRWKVLLDGDDFLIFDLERDIAERHDLANEHGEVGRRLIPLFVQWDRDVDEDARRTQSVKRV